ncbi:MAG: CRISPR-associated protein Cas5 [Anaerolineae bacterium]|nr:CRISPR-associated protein Cas5 [Anaerolineae bacterium]
MRVLKVVAEGLTTSFRYPHFMQQIHPSYQMPPPATIYGHIASALGEWFEPAGVQFAYHFTAQGSVQDMEHIIVLSAATGKLPDTEIPKVLEGNVNPFRRELLFQPRLTLYLNRPEWENAFRHPRYAVVLGRSQDLFTYTRTEVVDLQPAAQAYFEHTLLPHSMATQVRRGVTVLMPRYLDYARKRAPVFSRYLVLQERVHSADFITFDQPSVQEYWTDPQAPIHNGAALGLAFHSFVGDDGEALTLA